MVKSTYSLEQRKFNANIMSTHFVVAKHFCVLDHHTLKARRIFNVAWFTQNNLEIRKQII